MDDTQPQEVFVLASFWIRFVLVVVAGAAVGLAVGAVGRYGFGADWNIFAAASWGIMAGSIGLSFSYALKDNGRGKPRGD